MTQFFNRRLYLPLHFLSWRIFPNKLLLFCLTRATTRDFPTHSSLIRLKSTSYFPFFRQRTSLTRLRYDDDNPNRIRQRNVEKINICSIFDLPSGIYCTNEDRASIILSKSCILAGRGSPDWSNNPLMYGLPSSTKYTNIIDYNTIECLAGIPIIPIEIPKKFHSEEIFPTLNFHYKYIQYFKIVRNILINSMSTTTTLTHMHTNNKYINGSSINSINTINSQPYAVIHWRRGDQLHTRCNRNWKYKKESDHSINCATIHEFITK
eukprot:gene12663-26672_t